jgi:thiamine-phosphate pyrophosphorylase
MRADWSAAAVRALDAAKLWAQRRSSAQPRSLHLLLGLLDENEGRAADLMGKHGLKPEAALSLLSSLPEAGISVTNVDALLQVAVKLAVDRFGEASVRSEHLLLAILQEDVGLRARLETAGLRVTELEDTLAGKSEPALAVDDAPDLSEPAGRNETARILDAAANRAREAIRVVEDYCRFGLDDAFLCREAKTLRHDLAAALEKMPGLLLLRSRDTRGDVGTEIGTASETQRDSAVHVAHVNLKRLQEALRSLEEYGKVLQPELGLAIERLRYRAYTLERAIVLPADSRALLANTRLYLLVTPTHCQTSLQYLVAEAAAGGVDMIQLREKELSDHELLQRAKNMRRWTRQAGVLLIVNDRPDIAQLVDADGVHLGQDDLPVREARRIIGADAIVGVSTHSLDQVRRASVDGASYIGVGPVFPSATKSFPDFPGLEFVRNAVRETSLPAFALGGIAVENLAEVVAAGVTRIAVSAAICGAQDPRAAAQVLRGVLERAC